MQHRIGRIYRQLDELERAEEFYLQALTIDANNVPNPPDIQPDGGATLDFLFPIDLTMQPDTYQPAAVTNLFYWVNVMHDVTQRYGFDEEAGNMQATNYTGQGQGGDAVLALAQVDANNAALTDTPSACVTGRLSRAVSA